VSDYDVQLRTWNVVWFGLREPDWEYDDEEWEEEEFSLRVVKKRRKGNWTISKDSKNP
jgi:hypothetical protein